MHLTNDLDVICFKFLNTRESNTVRTLRVTDFAMRPILSGLDKKEVYEVMKLDSSRRYPQYRADLKSLPTRYLVLVKTSTGGCGISTASINNEI